MTRGTHLIAVAALAVLTAAVHAQKKIYWGDAVPAGWHGTWPADLQTVPERTRFTRTTVGWGLFDATLRELQAAGKEVIYPVFKVRREPK